MTISLQALFICLCVCVCAYTILSLVLLIYTISSMTLKDKKVDQFGLILSIMASCNIPCSALAKKLISFIQKRNWYLVTYFIDLCSFMQKDNECPGHFYSMTLISHHLSYHPKKSSPMTCMQCMKNLMTTPTALGFWCFAIALTSTPSSFWLTSCPRASFNISITLSCNKKILLFQRYSLT